MRPLPVEGEEVEAEEGQHGEEEHGQVEAAIAIHHPSFGHRHFVHEASRAGMENSCFNPNLMAN